MTDGVNATAESQDNDKARHKIHCELQFKRWTCDGLTEYHLLCKTLYYMNSKPDSERIVNIALSMNWYIMPYYFNQFFQQ